MYDGGTTTTSYFAIAHKLAWVEFVSEINNRPTLIIRNLRVGYVNLFPEFRRCGQIINEAVKEMHDPRMQSVTCILHALISVCFLLPSSGLL